VTSAIDRLASKSDRRIAKRGNTGGYSGNPRAGRPMRIPTEVFIAAITVHYESATSHPVKIQLGNGRWLRLTREQAWRLVNALLAALDNGPPGEDGDVLQYAINLDEVIDSTLTHDGTVPRQPGDGCSATQVARSLPRLSAVRREGVSMPTWGLPALDPGEESPRNGN